MPHRKRELIILGGHDPEILKMVAERAEKGMLLVATEQWQDYRKTFQKLGVKKFERLDLETRADTADDHRVELVRQAKVIFFSGGDQLRITSSFGGSRLCDLMRERHAQGMALAGTSAGASVISETMLLPGPADALRMAPGLGLSRDFVIDPLFAEHGRLSRLLLAVAQNPRLLGVGIDRNTAIVVRDGIGFEVTGEGAVYVVNGQPITYSNLRDSAPDATISVHGLKLDVLSRGDRFDMEKRAALHP